MTESNESMISRTSRYPTWHLFFVCNRQYEKYDILMHSILPFTRTLTPHIPTRSTFPRRRRSNMVSATTPAPLSLSAAFPPTYPVVYSPVPTMRTLALLFDAIILFRLESCRVNLNYVVDDVSLRCISFFFPFAKNQILWSATGLRIQQSCPLSLGYLSNHQIPAEA